jgi:hypothetical protein
MSLDGLVLRLNQRSAKYPQPSKSRHHPVAKTGDIFFAFSAARLVTDKERSISLSVDDHFQTTVAVASCLLLDH